MRRSTEKWKVAKCLTYSCSMETSRTVFKNLTNHCFFYSCIFLRRKMNQCYSNWVQLFHRNLEAVWELLGDLCCPSCAFCMHRGHIHGKPCWILWMSPVCSGCSVKLLCSVLKSTIDRTLVQSTCRGLFLAIKARQIWDNISTAYS